MTTPFVGVSVTVDVHPHLLPSLFVAESGAVLSTIRTTGNDACVSLCAASLDDMEGWLRSVLTAVRARQEPVLPLEPVHSTHPEAVATP